MKSRIVENGFIDIHSHILFDVDDGAEDELTSVKMLEMAYRDGIRTVVATPHFHPVRCKSTKDKIQQNFDKLNEVVKKLHPDMRLYLGREVLYATGIEEKILLDKVFNINHTDYVLVEFSAHDSFQYIRTSLNNVLLSGNIPILAHVERYQSIVQDWKQVYELRSLGTVIQVNAASVTGDCGWTIKRFTKRLLKEHLVDVIATDAHSIGKRAPFLSKCVLYIEKKYGSDYANDLAIINPFKIINNRYLEE